MDAIACRLTTPELQARRDTVLRVLGRAVMEIRELSDGWEFQFVGEADRLRELVDFIAFERQCCPFLRFSLTVEPNDGALWLGVTGPGEAKEFIATVFE